MIEYKMQQDDEKDQEQEKYQYPVLIYIEH
jgi:hypothetical protein